MSSDDLGMDARPAAVGSACGRRPFVLDNGRPHADPSCLGHVGRRGFDGPGLAPIFGPAYLSSDRPQEAPFWPLPDMAGRYAIRFGAGHLRVMEVTTLPSSSSPVLHLKVTSNRSVPPAWGTLARPCGS